MANELYKQLQPCIHKARELGQIICFGGHSLGGALATLICCLAVLHQRLPAHQVQCATFGSPPVLAHRDGKNGEAILQVRSCAAAQLLSHCDAAQSDVSSMASQQSAVLHWLAKVVLLHVHAAQQHL